MYTLQDVIPILILITFATLIITTTFLGIVWYFVNRQMLRDEARFNEFKREYLAKWR